MNVLPVKIRAMLEIIRHFQNPFLVIALRLGVLRLPFFAYRIKAEGVAVTMLGRPAMISLGDLFVLRELFIEQVYRDLLPLLGQGAVSVVDVGANLGAFVIWLDQRHGVRKAYCFEPMPTSFQLCRLNLAQNGCSQATAIQSAVGGAARKVTLPLLSDRPGGVSIYDRGTGDSQTTEVNVLGFKDWMTDTPDEFDVLKLDCEGAEWEILDRTPTAQFRRFRLVVAEVHQDTSGQHQVDDFPKIFEAHGFETIRWDGHSHGVYLGRRRAL